jgi:hypothetical protein
MARFVWWTPAAKILPAQLRHPIDRVPHVSVSFKEQTKPSHGPFSAVFFDGIGISPSRRSAHINRVFRLAPALGSPYLESLWHCYTIIRTSRRKNGLLWHLPRQDVNR